MSKVAVSVSMDVDLAQSLRNEAEAAGDKFSGLVCRYIYAGRNLETGLLSSTAAPEEEDGDPGVSLEPVEETHQADDRPASERVYSCLSSERQSLTQIAERSGVSESEVGDIIDGLANNGEPINLRVIDGIWHCWEEKT